MITSVKIKDNTKTPFEYVSDIEAFENGREFIFKPGVNVIIGKNGSGKSTLLNIISMYALCEKSMCSEMPAEALDFPPIFDDDDKVKRLWIYSASGTLHVMMHGDTNYNPTPEFTQYGGSNIENSITIIDGIPNDGGDW